MTMLGGWYVYDALGEKLSFKVRPLEEFNVQYLTTGYYGSLYRLLPISGVEGDVYKRQPTYLTSMARSGARSTPEKRESWEWRG